MCVLFSSKLQYKSGSKANGVILQNICSMTAVMNDFTKVTSNVNNGATESSITSQRKIKWWFCLSTWGKAWITEQGKMMASNRTGKRQLVCERRLHTHDSDGCHTVHGSCWAVDWATCRHIRVQECCALGWRPHRRARVIWRRRVWRWPDRRQLPTVGRTHFLYPSKHHTTLHLI